MPLDAAAKARAKAAVLGQLVADAATMSMHWIYDAMKIQELLSAEGLTATPEFFPKPSCSFYQSELGQQSPFGCELVPLLKTVADNGEFDAVKYSEALYTYFSASPAYRNKCVKDLFTNYEAGKRGVDCGEPTDFQANCVARAAIIVAKYGGSPELLTKAEQCIRVCQNNDAAVKYGLAAVRILEKVVVDGWKVEKALQWAASEAGLPDDIKELVELALSTKTKPLTELRYEPPPFMKEMVAKHEAAKDTLPAFTWTVWCNGASCGNPGAFTNSAIAALTFPSYVEAVRTNIVASGDNCSRALFIGALFAAQDGLDSIPVEWRSKTTGYAEYEAQLDKLLA